MKLSEVLATQKIGNGYKKLQDLLAEDGPGAVYLVLGLRRQEAKYGEHYVAAIKDEEAAITLPKNLNELLDRLTAAEDYAEALGQRRITFTVTRYLSRKHENRECYTAQFELADSEMSATPAAKPEIPKADTACAVDLKAGAAGTAAKPKSMPQPSF